MRTIKVTFDDDDYLITSVNGTVDEIEQYYLNRKFYFSDEYENEKMHTAIKIEFLDEER